MGFLSNLGKKRGQRLLPSCDPAGIPFYHKKRLYNTKVSAFLGFHRFYFKTIVILLIILPIKVLPQTYQKQQCGLLFYNTISGGIVGGIGAMINHKDNQKLSKAFIRGFSRGCIGGAVNYSAKLTTHMVVAKSTLGYAVPAKIIHSFGTSIVENAALNKRFLETYHINIAFARIEYNKKISAQVMPGAIIGLAVTGAHGAFQPWKSLQTLTPYFKGNMSFAVVNSIVISENLLEELSRNSMAVVTHELIHTMQSDEYLMLNAWTGKIKSKRVRPYKNLYLDFPYFMALHSIEECRRNANKNSLYNSNFFEFEAHSFQTMLFQKRHR